MMSMVALIPARAGSKGLPGKNKKRLLGKPLISYTIEAAIRSKLINDIIVSSDDPDILLLAQQTGTKAYSRPKSLAEDHTQMHEVISHTIEKYRLMEQKSPQSIILLQPTCPLRTEVHIDEAIRTFNRHSAASLVSVCEVSEHPYLMKRIVQGRLQDYVPHEMVGRRQELPPVYRLNGCLYIVSVDLFMRFRSLHFDDTLAFVMDRNDSIDIDDASDFQLAEWLLERRKSNP